MTNQYDPNAALLVPVKGIGVFTFAMRSLGNQFKIESEYCRLTEGLSNITVFLGNLAQTVADIGVLVVSGPPGWATREDILSKDAYSPEVYEQLQKVWGALRDKEASFRGIAPEPKTVGEGDVGDDGAVVPAPLPPAAD